MSQLESIAGQLRSLALSTGPIHDDVLAAAQQLRSIQGRVQALRRSGVDTGAVAAAVEDAERRAKAAADAVRTVRRDGTAWADELARGGGGGRGAVPTGGVAGASARMSTAGRRRDPEPVAELVSRHPQLDVQRERSGSSGDWNQELRHPRPNVVYVVDERFAFRTDHLGRVVEAVGTLDRLLPTEEGAARRHDRDQSQAGGPDRLEVDEGGHIFAAVFGGPGEAVNLLPQHHDQNRAMTGVRDNWNAMERTWRDIVKDGGKVEVRVVVSYGPTSRRPKRYTVDQSVGGVVTSYGFRNPTT